MVETTGNKRTRRTREQIMADLERKLEAMRAKAQGTYDESQDETFIVKHLRRAIRRNETAVRNADTLLQGRPGTDKSPAIADIDSKIANAEQRVRDLNAAKTAALTVQAQAPFNIQKLTATLALAEAGETVEMPGDLFALPGDDTDVQKEVAFANKASD